jgi:hypothetical protein
MTSASLPGLVFICGFPSSGTDLLKNLLNAHPEIRISGEFPLLPSLARRFADRLSPAEAREAVKDIVACDVYGNLARREIGVDESVPTTFAAVYSALLQATPSPWTGNKTPQNAENVESLNRLFPEARYILIVRDPRDVALSWKKKWGKDPLLCVDRWNARMSKALDALRSLDGQRSVVVTYEDLLRDHEAVARRLCAFLGVAFHARMREPHLFVESRTAGKLNYGQPVNSDNTRKWTQEFAPAVVKRIEEIAFDACRRLGYPLEFASRPVPMRAFERIRGRLVDSAAMLVVANRALAGGTFAYRLRAFRLEIAKRFGRFRMPG